MHVRIDKIDTATDWYDDAVAAIAAASGLAPDWDAIEVSTDTSGYEIGYYRDADGTLYRGRHNPQLSDDDEDVIDLDQVDDDDASIDDLADEMDRLCPSQVDTTIAPNGEQMAGHRGSGIPDEEAGIGWYCDGGNAGNPVLRIHADDIGRAVARLRQLDDGALDDGGLKEALTGLRIVWSI